MKKKLAFLLALVLTISMLPVGVSACNGCHAGPGHKAEVVSEQAEPFVASQGDFAGFAASSPFASVELGIDAFMVTPGALWVGEQQGVILQDADGSAIFEITTDGPDGVYDVFLSVWDGTGWYHPIPTPGGFEWPSTLTITNGTGNLVFTIPANTFYWGDTWLSVALVSTDYILTSDFSFALTVNPPPIVINALYQRFQNAWGQFDDYGEIIGFTHRFFFVVQAENFPEWVWAWLDDGLSFSGLIAGDISWASIGWRPNGNLELFVDFNDIVPEGVYQLEVTIDVYYWYGFPPVMVQFTLTQDQCEDSIRQEVLYRPSWHVGTQLAPVRAGEFGIASFPVTTRNVPNGQYSAFLHYWATQEDIDAGFQGNLGDWIALEIPGVVLSEVLHISNNEGIIMLVVTPDAQLGEHPFCVDMFVPRPGGGDFLLTSGTRWLMIDKPGDDEQPAAPTGGVSFDYVNFPQTASVNLNANRNFHIHAQLTPEGRASDFAAMHFTWLRNGQPWASEGGGGSIPATDILNPGFAGIRLQLEGGLTQAQRGGNWTLQVSLVSSTGEVLFSDTSRVSTLTVTTPGQGNQGQGQQGAGQAQQPAAPAPPADDDEFNIVTTDDAAEIIQEALDALEEGEQPVIRFELEEGEEGVSISGESLQALIEYGASVVIESAGFIIAFSPAQLAALGAVGGSELTFIVTPVAGGMFLPMLRMAVGAGFVLMPFSHLLSPTDISTALLNDFFMSELLEVSLLIDGEPVELAYGAMLSMDLSGINMTMVQEARLTGIVFYGDPADSRYIILGGTLEDGLFSFPIFSSGVHGVMTQPTSVEMRLEIGSAAYSLDGIVRASAIGTPFVDPATSRTMVPLRLITDALGADVSWLNETRTVTISRNGVNLFLSVDAPLFIAGENMGTPMIIDGRTFVPLRYVSEVLEAYVLWDGGARAVYVFE
ncbi:MAG: copper amine oxidase N-terminal domain-containing protein [Defluviitaleaceae bacterium]|nr:copper amine oxidase N-terminal domain-containing protein [Defluviitaleaceae bacterium]